MNRMWQSSSICSTEFVASYRERTAVHGLAAHDFIERRAERVAAEHADHQRRAPVGECSRGPVDELGEVEEEDRLDLILGRRGRRLSANGRSDERQQHCNDGGSVSQLQNCHVTFP